MWERACVGAGLPAMASPRFQMHDRGVCIAGKPDSHTSQLPHKPGSHTGQRPQKATVLKWVRD
ncbi:hypothetical protein DJ480_03795 [Pseudomonas sp. Leaf98]|nr:hypothetical protein DJ480_03795 [Pseudomonas sp. Leaf98]